MKKITITFIGLFLLVLPMHAQSELTADNILDNYFENTGGIDAWKSLSSMEMHGKQAFGPQEFPFVIKQKAPNLLIVEVDVAGQRIVAQAFDGTTAWTLNPMMGAATAQPLPTEQQKLIEADADFEDDFINYQEKGHQVTLEGIEEIEGVECYKIVLTKNANNEKDERVEHHFFDNENFVPIMVRSFVAEGPQKGAELNQYLSEYDEVEGGFIMPHYIETKAGGQSMGKLTIEKIILNGEIADESFAFPEEK
jgi:outer membrane lipoprotein-sorting protein